MYDATLTERRPERWAGAYRSSRKKKTPYICQKKWNKLQNNLYQYPLQQGWCTRKANTLLYRRFPVIKKELMLGSDEGVCVRRDGSKLGHSPNPPPHPLNRNAGVLYIDRRELTQRLSPLTQRPNHCTIFCTRFIK